MEESVIPQSLTSGPLSVGRPQGHARITVDVEPNSSRRAGHIGRCDGPPVGGTGRCLTPPLRQHLSSASPAGAKRIG
jgi:hypothetical protein